MGPSCTYIYGSVIHGWAHPTIVYTFTLFTGGLIVCFIFYLGPYNVIVQLYITYMGLLYQPIRYLQTSYINGPIANCNQSIQISWDGPTRELRDFVTISSPVNYEIE